MGLGPVAGVHTARNVTAVMHEQFESLPTAVAYLAVPDFVIEYANEEYLRLVHGRSVLGLPVREAMPELAEHGLSESLESVIRSGRSIRGDGAEFWVQRPGEGAGHVLADFLCQPVRDDAGGLAGVLLFVGDAAASMRDERNYAALPRQLAVTRDRYRTLFETLPQGVIYYAADGMILESNPAATEILGIDADAMLTRPLAPTWQAVDTDGAPYRAEDFPVTVALRTGNVVVDTVIGVPHGRTGELRWLRVTAVPDALDEAGHPQRAYAMFRDVTEQRRSEVALRDSNELMARLREANAVGVVVTGEQQILSANDAYLDIIGYTRDDLEAGRISWRDITPPDWAEIQDDALTQLRRTGTCRPFEKEYVHRDGHRVPVLVGSAAMSRNPLRWTSFVVDLTTRQRAESERAGLLARERAARAETERARERLTFLLRAGDLAASGADRYELIQHAAELVVHSLADFCVVFLPDEDGGVLRATSVAHREPARGVTAADLRDFDIPIAGLPTVQAAWRTGLSQLTRDAAANVVQRADFPPVLRQIIARMDPEYLLATPLMAGRRPLGVLALGRSAGWSGFAETDIAVVEDIGRRMAVGLANADTFAREHTVSETLQRAVLPGHLPEMARLDLAVRYLPTTEGVAVGGDWYDAFPLPGNRVGLAIGDVVGHNIDSASIMGQLRSLLRAYAIDREQPSDVMHCTNTALTQLLPEAMATAAYAVLDLATGDFTYANAGHPPPVCTSATGDVEYLDDAAGTMLGAPGNGVFTTGYRRLGPGDALLLYTDGLIEARDRDITAGFGALASAMRQGGTRSAEQTCATAQATLLGTAPRADDVCLLAARLTG